MVGYIYVNHIRLDGTLLLIHVVACEIPLFGMAYMLFLRKSYKSAVPAHDRSTTMFLRWTVFLCLIMAACVTYEGSVGHFPVNRIQSVFRSCRDRKSLDERMGLYTHTLRLCRHKAAWYCLIQSLLMSLCRRKESKSPGKSRRWACTSE